MASFKLFARSTLPWAVGISMLISAFSACGQPTSTSNRITQSQIAALLKQDSTLSTGFKSPKNVTVKVVKPVKGGVALSFRREDGAHGELTVLGPPTVMEKGFWTGIVDRLLELIEDGKKGGTGGGNACGNVNITGNNNTVIVQGNGCTAG